MALESYDYESVVEIIKRINKLHSDFSKSLEPSLNYNLKKTIDKVANETGVKPGFQRLIDLYKTELNQFIIKILPLQVEYSGIRYRIKQSESIREKIKYYLGPQHENGKVPINKSLNDFLGFRILVDNVVLICNNLKQDKSIENIIDRMYMRNEDDYVGLHIYFKNGNNKFFPWELQIWSVNNFKSNEISHKNHKEKRKYISIPKDYYQADLEKEE